MGFQTKPTVLKNMHRRKTQFFDNTFNRKEPVELLNKNWRNSVCSWGPGSFPFVLTLMTLTGTLVASHMIPIMQVRSYLLDKTFQTISELNRTGVTDYAPMFMQENWPVYSYAEGVDQIMDLVEKSLQQIRNDSDAQKTVMSERRRLAVYWRDCSTYYPILITLLLVSLSMHLVLRCHPMWREASLLTPYFGLIVFHCAIMILQLATLFSNVKMHRAVNKLFKNVSVTRYEEIGAGMTIPMVVPLTFCIAPPANFSTIYLLTLFTNALTIFVFLDAMDSDS
ncbi:unnamed protein product [Mesocestoides corti]|uniref:Uncharacterized protein n=1 Tax=Mesocestoides corti TaxID=53468 RepID=A0A0R3UF37_MESCO|nr:unnamed protein product [Mesocestoides corti]